MSTDYDVLMNQTKLDHELFNAEAISSVKNLWNLPTKAIRFAANVNLQMQ